MKPSAMCWTTRTACSRSAGSCAEQRQQRLRPAGRGADRDQAHRAAAAPGPGPAPGRAVGGGRGGAERRRRAGQPLRPQPAARVGDDADPRGDAQLAAQRGGVLLEGAGVVGAGLGEHVDGTGGQRLEGVLAVRRRRRRRCRPGSASACALMIRSIASMPLITGRSRSMRTAAGRSRSTSATASLPLRASPTTVKSPLGLDGGAQEAALHRGVVDDDDRDRAGLVRDHAGTQAPSWSVSSADQDRQPSRVRAAAPSSASSARAVREASASPTTTALLPRAWASRSGVRAGGSVEQRRAGEAAAGRPHRRRPRADRPGPPAGGCGGAGSQDRARGRRAPVALLTCRCEGFRQEECRRAGRAA